MKGIVLAGGRGTRLSPMTLATSKQLLAVYDKPMIYHPISTLMLAGIREILIISTPHDHSQFVRLLGDGSQWGITFEYATQEQPEGIAQSLIIGEDFIAGDRVSLILGDNIFFGSGLGTSLSKMLERPGATIFAYEVEDPKDYGVVELDADGLPLSIEEKPVLPRSKFAIPGLYSYDSRCVEFSKSLKRSSRGELEISDLHRIYLESGQLSVEVLDQGQQWFDAGTVENLFQASSFLRSTFIETNQKIGCPEEAAFRNQWIDSQSLKKIANSIQNQDYRAYLAGLAEHGLLAP
jgi:glucose-1-phosphate thymidylyltransferase